MTRPERTRSADVSGGPRAAALRQAARAAALLDRLRRCEIWPFMLQSEVADIAQGVVTQMSTDDLKNESGGVLVVTRGRIFSEAAKGATAIGGPAGNVSLRLLDNDGARPVMRQPVLLPTLFARDTNTWVLDRPHVLSVRGSFSAYLTEEGSGATTDVSLMLMGDAVLGDITASEVDELVGMGLYPGVAGSGVAWAGPLLLSQDLPDGIPAGTELAILSLRGRVAELRTILLRCRSRAVVLSSSVADVPANGSADVPSDSLRNDTGWPLLVTAMMTSVVDGPSSTGVATAPYTLLSAEMSVLIGRTRRPLVWRPTVAALIGCADSGVWALDRPMVLDPGSSVEVKVQEEGGSSANDLYVSVHGQLVEGIGAAELRECVALGLLDGWRAQRD